MGSRYGPILHIFDEICLKVQKNLVKLQSWQPCTHNLAILCTKYVKLKL